MVTVWTQSDLISRISRGLLIKKKEEEAISQCSITNLELGLQRVLIVPLSLCSIAWYYVFKSIKEQI